jgi:hypothetical protein
MMVAFMSSSSSSLALDRAVWSVMESGDAAPRVAFKPAHMTTSWSDHDLDTSACEAGIVASLSSPAAHQSGGGNVVRHQSISHYLGVDHARLSAAR